MAPPPTILELTVTPDMIDYNGHLTEPVYYRIFTDAMTKFLEDIEIGSTHRLQTGRTVYSVEGRILFFREVKEGAALSVTGRILAFDGKRLHTCFEMSHAGARISAYENVSLYVEQKPDSAPSVASFDAATQARLERLRADHDEEWPAFIGRPTGLSRR